MPAHTDILDDRESLAMPFVGSVVLHAALAGAFVYLALYQQQHRVNWGFENAGGGPGSVAISPVKTLPLPQRSGQINPLANQSESRLPQIPAKPQPKAQPKPPEPDAIPLKSNTRPRPEAAQNRYRPPREELPNQVYSHEAPALVSNMIAKTGSGQLGVGAAGPLGTQCGAYASQIQQLVATRWHTGDIDSRITTAPPVVFTFNLHRDGTIDGLDRRQTSGNYQIDTSAQRALLEATPFPPITCGSNGGVIEFWFQLKR
jgi:outer membrane biosynthesis protein TonB